MAYYVKNKEKSFKEFSIERVGEIQDLSKQIDFNNLIYYFKSKDGCPIHLISFKGPLGFYRNILDGHTTLEKYIGWYNTRKSGKRSNCI